MGLYCSCIVHVVVGAKTSACQAACMHLGLVELPAVDDSGGAVRGEVEGVDKCGVAVVVDAHGAALVDAHQQRPERVVQQRRNSLNDAGVLVGDPRIQGP